MASGNNGTSDLQDLLTCVRRHNIRAFRNTGAYVLGQLVGKPTSRIVVEAGFAAGQQYESIVGDDRSPLKQYLDASWQRQDRPNVMLIGEGGIGKTVALQSAAEELTDEGIPAIYVPLYRMPHLNARTNILQSYIGEAVLDGDDTLQRALRQHMLQASVGNVANDPNVVLLLDGWNEIGQHVVDGIPLGDLLREEIETRWCKPGVQVVVAGRVNAGFDLTANVWETLRVRRLEWTYIEQYLLEHGLDREDLPAADDPLRQTLGNPLMLTLYEKSNGQQGGVPNWIHCCNFITDERSSTQGAVMWNFLQCQIAQAMTVHRDERALAYAGTIVINYVASYIGWKMLETDAFRLTLQELESYIDEAWQAYVAWWEDSPFDLRARRDCSAQPLTWDQRRLEELLLDAISLMFDGDPDNGHAHAIDEPNIGFVHQKFRDFYAAMYLRLFFTPYGNCRSANGLDAWRRCSLGHETLMLAAPLFTDGDLGHVWDAQRYQDVDEGNYAISNLLSLYQAKGVALSTLSYDHLDLRTTSLANRGLDATGGSFRGCQVGSRTIASPNYTGQEADIAWPRRGFRVTDDSEPEVWVVGMGIARYELRTAAPLGRVGGFPAGINKVVPWGDGTFCVALDTQGEVYAGNAESDIWEKKPRAHGVVDVSAASKGRLWAGVTKDGAAVLSCGGEPALVHNLNGIPVGNPLRIAANADGTQIVVYYNAADRCKLVFYAIDPNDGNRLSQTTSVDVGNGLLDVCFGDENGNLVCVFPTTIDVYDSRGRLISTFAIGVQGHEVGSAEVSQSGRSVAVAYGAEVRIYSLDDGSVIRTILLAEKDSHVKLVSISPDDRYVACCHEGHFVTIWETRQPDPGVPDVSVARFDAAKRDVASPAQVGDDELFGVVGGKYAVWWRLHSLEISRLKPLPVKDVRCSCVTPVGNLLAVGCFDGSCVVLSLPSLKTIFAGRLPDVEVSSCSVSADGSYALFGTSDGQVYQLDLTKEEPRQLEPLFCLNYYGAQKNVTWTYAGREVLYAGCDSGIVDARRHGGTAPVTLLKKAGGSIGCIAMSCNEETLVFVCNGGVYVCDGQGARLLCEPDYSFVARLAISPDGAWVSVGLVDPQLKTKGVIEVYDVASAMASGVGGPFAPAHHLTTTDVLVYDMAFVCDGSKLVYGGLGGGLRLADLVSPQGNEVVCSYEPGTDIPFVGADFSGAKMGDDVYSALRSAGAKLDNVS